MSDLSIGDDGLLRCRWATSAADYVSYHDEEWGVPVRNDVALFERLTLESFQSGLSWLTVLRKRDNFRRAFAGFDPESVARFGEKDIERLLADAGIIRHRGKIESAINNARSLVAAWATFGTTFLTDTLTTHIPTDASLVAQGFPRPPLQLGQLPAQTSESKALAKLLKSHGFVFLGPTTLYAALQATGFVNDHLVGCHRAQNP